MAKNSGPCLEFVMNRENAKIYFDLLPGTTSKNIFCEVRNALDDVFTEIYGKNNDYIKRITLEDGTPSLSFYYTKLQGVLKAILETRRYSNLSLKINVVGEDKNGNKFSKLISHPLEVSLAAEGIPYTNKANNDMTTRRR